MEKTGDDQRSFLEVIIHTAILTLTSILSLAGNSLVCLAFYRNRRLRTITNFYVLSLAVADMTMAVFYFPFGAVASSLHKWPFTKCYCHFTSFLGASWAQISTFTLALASLNRYFCVVKPHRYSTLFTRKKAIISIVALWLFSWALTPLFFAANPIYEWSPIFLNCRAIFKDEQAMRISYLSFGCLFIVPMSLVILCYSSIHHVIRHHNNAIVPSLQQNNSQATRIQDIKTCRVVFVAVLGFCLCWSPFISTMVLEFGFQIPIYPSVLSISFLLTSASAYINPLIYGVMNQTMRVEFLKILLLRSG